MLSPLKFILLFDIHSHHNSLFFSNFLFFDSILMSFSNLINNDLSSTLSSFKSSLFSQLFFVESLQSFDFHHNIKFLLFVNPFFFELFALDELFISNCYYFGVETHLVHVLNIVQLFIKHHLCTWKKTLFPLSLLKW